MFVFFSKLLPSLIYPLGLACLLILAAIWLYRSAKLQRGLLVAALLLLWIGGNRWVATGLARSLEWRFAAPVPVPAAEVIVVLGGGTNPPEAPRPMVELNSAGDRLIYAVQLYRAGNVKNLLVSGGLLDWDQRETTPAGDMAEMLVFLGVPQEAIWQQGDSANTYEDALYCAQILGEKGIERILLVTSAWHMPRAVGCFRRLGWAVTPYPVDYQTDGTFPAARAPDLTGGLAALGRGIREWIGLATYRWFDYTDSLFPGPQPG